MRILIVILVIAIPQLVLGSGTGNALNDASAMELAPSFELADLNGHLFALKTGDNEKPVLLWFTNLCPGCQAAIPRLDSLYRNQLQPDVELVAISLLGKNRKTVQSISNKLEFSFLVLIDPHGSVCSSYTGGYVPQSCPLENFYIIDADGYIRFRGHYPGTSEQEIQKVLESVRVRPLRE